MTNSVQWPALPEAEGSKEANRPAESVTDFKELSNIIPLRPARQTI